jgi:iron(III) transport system permease protein
LGHREVTVSAAKINVSGIRWPRIDIAEKLFSLAPAAIVVYLVLPPLVLLLVSSFKSTRDMLPTEPGGWSLSNYHEVFTSSETLVLLQNSVIYAVCTVVCAFVIAVALAWCIERTDLPGRNIIFTLLLLPLAIPGLIKAIGWSLLASPSVGAVNVFLRYIFRMESESGPFNIYSLPGIIFVSSLSLIPSVLLMIAGSFRNVDPAFEEASEASGASFTQTQRQITLPLLQPALLSAGIFFFASALDDFQIPAVLGLGTGIRVLSTKIFLAAQPTMGLPNYGLASGYAMLLFFMALGLILVYYKATRKGDQFAVVTGKNYQRRVVSLGKWKYLAIGVAGLYLLLAAVLPISILLWMSFQPFVSIPSVEDLGRATLSNYDALWQLDQFRLALGNTAFISVVVATATTFLSTLIAWRSVRGRSWVSALPDFLTFINSAVPSVVFGLAIMFVYLSFSILPLYGTVWIIIIALVTRYLTYSTRLMGGAVVQIHKELEEASQTSGASGSMTFYRITLPLILPSFLNSWLWVAVHTLKEATIAIMLMTPANVVLSALIWERFQEGSEHGLVASMCVLVVSTSFLLTFAVRKVLVSSTL